MGLPPTPVVGFLFAGDLDQVEAGVRDGGALPSPFCFSLAPEERQARIRKTVATLCVLHKTRTKTKTKKTAGNESMPREKELVFTHGRSNDLVIQC